MKRMLHLFKLKLQTPNLCAFISFYTQHCKCLRATYLLTADDEKLHDFCDLHD
jgi:hypothetical protein